MLIARDFLWPWGAQERWSRECKESVMGRGKGEQDNGVMIMLDVEVN